MSVFTLDVRAGNPVTVKDLDEVCDTLGVSICEEEKESYTTLLAVYHDSMSDLMAIPGKSEIEICTAFWHPQYSN